MNPVYCVDSVGKSFGDRRVLRNASAWGYAGRVSALMGRNGSGKSTLLRAGAGVLPMDSGTVRLHGVTYVHPRHARLAEHGLYFLPDIESLPWSLSLYDAAGWLQQRWGGGSAEHALRLMEVWELREARPYELSGGEQRRAGLALAIARRPDVLLADEPFAGIAPLDEALIAAGLKELTARGCAAIVTGHEVSALLAIADDVTWVVGGTSHALGSPAAACTHHQFRTEYLGSWFNPAGLGIGH